MTQKLATRNTACWCLAVWAAAACAAAAAGPVIDSAMEDDPRLAIPEPKIVFSKRLKPLWLKALARPEADLQRQVAEAVARAHRRGVPGLKDTIGPLTTVLTVKNQHGVVRLAFARTLVVLDARKSAPALFELLDREPLSFAQVVEPALADWDYRPARKVWLARLGGRNARRGYVRLAIRGLGIVRDSDAAEPLWTLAKTSSTDPTLRLEAARALARIRSAGLVDRAGKLAKNKSRRALLDRLVAASLLKRHSDKAAQRLLLDLSLDTQPTVAAVAVARLLEIDPLLVIPIVQKLLPNKDANVRLLAARALAAHPMVSSVKLLGPLLDDPHPDVRRYVCQTLYAFASKKRLSESVFTEAMRVLRRDGWRGQEQAGLLLGALDHKPAAKRLVALLESPRYEVTVASAWALRKLALQSTLSAMLDHATRVAAGRDMGNLAPGVGDEHLVQLLQAFGQMKYAKATGLMWRFIPKTSPFTPRERAAAIWALGHVDVGSKRKELSRLLQARLADVVSPMPEALEVRLMSAITLGRMKSKDAVGSLRKFYRFDGPQSLVGLACRWAVRQITGENLPGPKRQTIMQGGWFLEPLQKLSAPKPQNGK